MAQELWKSSNTGIKRKGTTFKELQSLFVDKITTKFIFEPLFCCKLNDESSDVKEILEFREFDIVGVINDDDQVIGLAEKCELNGGPIELFVKQISLSSVISESTPISRLLNVLTERSFAFVITENNINGIVTIADVNKPIVRIYLFGIISLFEIHLNYWIRVYHDTMSWREHLSKNRLAKASKLFEDRKGKNEELTLLECIQICDKRTILLATNDFIERFGFTNVQFEKLLTDIEQIRNEIAHSQNSIVSNLEWSLFVKTISDAEDFLFKSEMILEI